jgi:hypothetical protein
VLALRITTLALAIAVGSAGIARADGVAVGETLRINGYSSLEYERMLETVGRGDPNGSFDADLFDLVLNFQLHDDLRVAADLTWEHGPQTENDFGNVGVEYAWFEYSFADWARVRGGKMFTPFGIYNEIHTAKPAFLSVKEPFSTDKTDKFGAGRRLFPRWGTGLALLGNGPSPLGDWDYVVSVTNGYQETTNPYEEDDNKPKALTGRARLLVASQLELGASAYWDRLTELDGAGEPTGNFATQLAAAVHAIWKLPKPALGAEVELVSGRLEPSSASGRPSVQTNGLSAMVFWTIGWGVTPYFRWEWMDPDTNVADDQANRTIAGVNWRTGVGLILKAEWDRTRAGDANTYFSGGRGQYDEIKAAAVVGF